MLLVLLKNFYFNLKIQHQNIKMSLLSFSGVQTLSKEVLLSIKLGIKAFMNGFPKLMMEITRMTFGSVMIFVQIILALVQSEFSEDEES